ncbi:DNA-binding SARP family transcriptional activator [Stackebrandtia endophytica]|uniref:DNA-binding SARP family transcriptional activator n=1 Tax=Stackebrandtia endophytica TaxID=1496996 RepID=A0A543B045_9ACTN|nr:BTAD domain-containing putative transcriptional regulator [Stackebrandtia endophytica]TQL78198.1 DNA-binding SARP family transcriptional activator [Stackebrandtia endophytica]
MTHFPGIRISILGDVVVVRDGQSRNAGPAKQAAVLAALAVNVNEHILPETLIDRVWGADAADSARGNLYTHITRLRQLLEPLDITIDRGGDGGYRLRADPSHIDLSHSRSLTARARRQTEARNLTTAAQLWREAVGLYRGRPLGNITGVWADAARIRLRQERISLQEGLFAVELARGNHELTLMEIAEAVDAEPLRETLVAQLMHALYLCGRTDEAKARYDRTRDRFSDELGIVPNTALREMLHRITAEDPTLEPASRPTFAAPGGSTVDVTAVEKPVPRQLPRAPAGFVGRAGDIERLAAAERGGNISLITGMAGIGKTALALRWARSVADRYPDGQLFTDLRGASEEPPREPGEVIAGFLRALGVEGADIPADPVDRAELYRANAAGRRLLIVLDNAEDADQVRPLLPGDGHAHVLITSRHRLTDLTEGPQSIGVDVLSHNESIDLLTRQLGPDRLIAEPAAATRLVELCGRLPLALRIAAANLSEWPEFGIADYLADLSGEDRFAALSVPGDARGAVWPAFERSYRQLDEPSAQLFRAAGNVPGPTVSTDALAAMVDRPVEEVADLLEHLEAAHLVASVGPAVHGLHDLLKEFARQLASPPEARKLRGRLFTWYNQAARAAAEALSPGATQLPTPPPVGPVAVFADGAAAMDWFAAEQLNVTAITAAAAEVDDPVAWLLPDALRLYYARAIDFDAWHQTAQWGLEAAERTGTSRAIAAMHYLLSMRTRMGGDYVAGAEHLELALKAAREGNDVDMTINIHIGLSDVAAFHGDIRLGMSHCRQVVEHLDRLTLRQRTVVMTMLGMGHHDLGELQEARDCLEPLVAELRVVSREKLVPAIAHLGHAQFQLGMLDEAADTFVEALAVTREGTMSQEIVVRHLEIGMVHYERGDLVAAGREVESAREAAVRTATVLYEPRIRLMESMLEPDPVIALEHARAALNITGAGGHRIPESARIGIAEALIRQGRHREALAEATTTADHAEERHLRIFQAQALNLAARAHLGLSEPTRATEVARRALALHRSTGCRVGEARSLRLLAKATGEAEHATAAEHILAETGAIADPWDLDR